MVQLLLDDDKPLLLKTGEARKPTEKKTGETMGFQGIIYTDMIDISNRKSPPWTSFPKCPTPTGCILLVNPHRHPSVSRGENLWVEGWWQDLENDVIDGWLLVGCGWLMRVFVLCVLEACFKNTMNLFWLEDFLAKTWGGGEF